VKRVWRYALAAGTVAVAAPLPVAAQSYFGKNQVQYDRFDWKVIETEHFLVHYYPSEERAARDAARMAERAYGRLSRIFNYEFREKKPIVFFASRTDFGQNNVLGDLGEFTGGVTEALRHRILMPFTGDLGSFDQVLTHEMVHAFQYDLFARGKAGAGLQTLAAVSPPGWLIEGAAQYLSTGPNHAFTSTIIRDAAINGNLPTIEQLTERPDRWNPYTFGASFVAFIGQRYGDQTVGNIFNALPSVGVERAFRRETGKSLEDLGDEWREAMQVTHLPQLAQLERPRKFAAPLLTNRKSGGEVFLAPALSNDGKHIAFLSNGSIARGEVFIDLWLGNARTGKRLGRLVKSTFDPNFEELRLLYSQSSFSPDGRLLAFTAQRKGKDVLYILDVDKRRTRRRIDLPLEGVTGPTWSPDGQRIAFTGYTEGVTDLYVVNVDGTGLRRLTADRYGDLQPQWSPDGKSIAFATDRGPRTDLDVLRLSPWQIAVYDFDTRRVEVLPNQDGLNINPMWSPDGQSIAYVSDRTGIQNIFLYDLRDQEHYQLTNLAGAVIAATQYSPAITWAREADRLAFTYYENGDYTVWTVDNPRLLRRAPFRSEPSPLVAERTTASELRLAAAPQADSVGSNGAGSGNGVHASNGEIEPEETAARAVSGTQSYYRTEDGFRTSANVPATERRAARGVITVAALLDSAALALPDTTRFKEYDYKTRFSPEYVARPTIGYTRDNFGRGVFGGTAIVLADLLGNSRLAFAGEVNGRVSEARVLAAYTNLSRRLQYTAGIFQEPYYLGQSILTEIDPTKEEFQEDIIITRYVQRQLFGVGIYPLNRFTRFEFGARLTMVDRTEQRFSRRFSPLGSDVFEEESELNFPSVSYAQPYVAWVSDNVIYGFTAPIMGRRYRLQVEPAIGRYQWIDYLVDYRRYDPIIFNMFTVATRLMGSVSVGRDADTLRKYIGYSSIVRGYERETFSSNVNSCPPSASAQLARCSPLLGSRVMVGNVELRFPLVRRADIGGLISLPPIEGLVFFDAGIAWFGGQHVKLSAEKITDPQNVRTLLTSHGFGLRVNLFNFAILRWDYAIPHQAPVKDGFWRFSLGPSF
jgi:WD40 repeat protein